MSSSKESDNEVMAALNVSEGLGEKIDFMILEQKLDEV